MKRILYETPGNGKYIEFNYDKNVNENNQKKNPFRFYYVLLYLLIRECIHSIEIFHIWATSWQYQQNGMCAQRRLRLSLASTQSDQSLLVRLKKAWVLSYLLSVQRRLIRLGDCPGWSVIAGHTCHFVGFVLRWLIFFAAVLTSCLWTYSNKDCPKQAMHSHSLVWAYALYSDTLFTV